MRIEERNYSSKQFRPAPKVFKSQELDLLTIVTAWGEGNSTESISNEVSKFLFAAQGDFEATSPFEFNSALSKDSNSLRMATLISNDMVYRSENKDDIRSCYEMIVLFKNKNQLSWVQVGNPNLILLRDTLIPLSFTPPSIESVNLRSIALPSQFFGTEMHCYFQIGTIELKENDKLLLFTENKLSAENWALPPVDWNLNSFIKNQIKFNSDNPFWMGLINL